MPADTTTLTDLLARVKAASGADRELDARIWCFASGWRFRDFNPSTVFWEKPLDGFWIRGNSLLRVVPKYTASIDAAVELTQRLLPGWEIELIILKDAGHASIRGPDEMVDYAEATSKSAPLALLQAVLILEQRKAKP